jgi:hypothetical protein
LSVGARIACSSAGIDHSKGKPEDHRGANADSKAGKNIAE